MWCVGALAPWLAQGAGQLRRQGGSTCHPPRPVIAASAVVLTRPPVPTPTPETTALAARGSPLLPLSPPSPPLAFFLCRRRSSPLPLPPWSLLPVFFLCRRHLPCQPPPARLPPLSPPPACCRHCRRPAAPALGPPAVPPVGPWMAAPPSVRTATCGSILRFYLPPSPHPALHPRLSVAPGACTASPGRGTCVGGRRGGGQSAGEEEVAKITIRKRGEETTTTKGEQTTNGGGKGGRGQGTPRRCRSPCCCCCWERDDDASPADSPRRCRSLCCCWKRDDDTSPANSPRRLFCCRCCVGAATRTPRTRCGGAPLVLLLLGEGRRRRARGPLLYGEVRRHLAGVCRHGEAGRCPPGRPCRRCPPQHTPPSAAVPAVSPRLCFLGTVAVGRGRRVSSERLPYGQ